PILFFLGGFIAWKRSGNIKSKSISLAMFFVPYLLITALWVGWNYKTSGDFVFLQKVRGHFTKLEQLESPEQHLFEYVRVIGGQYIAWDPKGHVHPFINELDKPLNQALFP